tara:strand:- start:867 stop:2147 length:1281 start_codon:yes stop_codon:yes gene_type:complete
MWFGSVPIAKVYTTTLTTSSDLGIWSVGGDWVYDTDETNSQSGTADNWLMMVAPYNTNQYSTTPISYNTSTHTFTELAADWTMYALGGTSHSGSGQQLSLDRGVWGMRSSAGAFTARMYYNDLAADLGSFDNNVNVYTEPQIYNGGVRINDTQGVHASQSNFQRMLMGTYEGGPSPTVSTVTPASTVFYYDNFSSPGSSGKTYANVGTTNQFIYTNYADSNTFDENTTRVDINHMSWTGAGGGALTRTDNDNAVTLPTHTGSTARPVLLATTWGNVLIHLDTANPSNSAVFPITWSGGTATVGSSVAFAGGTSIPAGECFLLGLDGMRYGNYSKYTCGQNRSGSNTDLYRTVRLYTSGSDIVMDTITIDFSNSDGSNTVTRKQEAVHTFTSTSSTTVWPVFMANNTDLGIWHQDTAEWVYIENAFY